MHSAQCTAHREDHLILFPAGGILIHWILVHPCVPLCKDSGIAPSAVNIVLVVEFHLGLRNKEDLDSISELFLWRRRQRGTEGRCYACERERESGRVPTPPAESHRTFSLIPPVSSTGARGESSAHNGFLLCCVIFAGRPARGAVAPFPTGPGVHVHALANSPKAQHTHTGTSYLQLSPSFTHWRH